MLANMVSAKTADGFRREKEFTACRTARSCREEDRRKNSLPTVRFAGRPTTEGCFGKASTDDA
jgi:hypothetical protein